MATQPFVIVPSMCAVAVMYPQGRRIADEVLPRVPVDGDKFNYLKYAQADAFLAPDTTVGRLSAPNQLLYSSTEVTDSVTDQALDVPVPDRDIKAWNDAHRTGRVQAPNPMDQAVESGMDAFLNRREVRAAGLVFNAASYGTNNKVTLSGTSQWSDYTNSDPLVAIRGYFDSMLVRPTIGVLGRLVATKLQLHPKVAAAVYKFGTTAGYVPMRAIADQLELDEIYVGEAQYNTAAPGQAPSMSRVWGKHAAFLYRDKTASTRGKVTFGFTAQWGDRQAGTITDPDIGALGGVRARVVEFVKELVTANDLGYFVQNAIA